MLSEYKDWNLFDHRLHRQQTREIKSVIRHRTPGKLGIIH
jgi:hypothetical protein